MDSYENVEQVFSECIPAASKLSYELCNTIRFELFPDISEIDLEKYNAILGNIVDLFDMDFEADTAVIPAIVWEIIRDICNEYAVDLDEDLMTYIFQKIMAAGKL